MSDADMLAVDGELLRLACACKVPETHHEVLSNFDIALFGRVAADASTLDQALEELLSDTAVPESAAQRLLLFSSFRLLYDKCRQHQGLLSEPNKSMPEAPPAPPVHRDSWSESFPAKLSGEKVQSLRDSFESAYPGELLDSENFPSSRMLALCFKYATPGELKWVPWKYRMSQAQHESHSLRRPSKIPRLEDFLYDDVPSREIPTGQVGFHLLSSLLGLNTLGLALVKAAHLGSLRMYERKFLKLAFQRYEAGSGLRGPTAEEMMAADRRLWDIIAELVNSKKWSLDDAIAEVVDVRSDMASLLQPRPLPPKNVPVDVPRNFWRPSKGNKGKGKGGGKGGAKGAGKQVARFGDSRSSSDQKWVSTYESNGEQHVLCMRHSTREGCSNPSCRYEHLCPVVKPDGAPCLGRRPAWQHRN